MPTRRLLTQPWSMLAAASVILLIAAGSFLATPLWWDGQSPVKAQDNQGAISNLVLSSPNPGQLALAWNAPSEAPTDYRVRWAPTGEDYLSFSEANTSERGSAYPTGTSHTVNNLTAGASYKVQVRARYNGGEHAGNPWSGPWSGQETITISSPPPPPPTPTPEPAPEPASDEVTSLALSSGAAGELAITWTQPTEAPTDYRISWTPAGEEYLSYSKENTSRRGNSYPDGDTSTLTLTGLPGGINYKVMMRARYHDAENDAHTSGPWTAEVTQSIQSSPPAAPTGLTASEVSDSSVSLSWTTPSGEITGYRVLRGLTAAKQDVLENDTGSARAEYVDTAVEAETRYHYSVRAINDAGVGPASETMAVTTEDQAVEPRQFNLAGTVTLTPTDPDLGLPITAAVTDPDPPITGETWHWSKSATGVELSFTDITGATGSTYRPVEDDVGYFLRANVMYTDAKASGNRNHGITSSAVASEETNLVSNISNSIYGPASTGYSRAIAQGFVTGGHPNGYKFTKATIDTPANPNNFKLKLYSSTHSNNLIEGTNTEIFTFTYASSNGRWRTFLAPTGTRLAPNTTYHLNIVPDGADAACLTTGSLGDSGGQDWSIMNTINTTNSQGATTLIVFANVSCLIRIRGEAATDVPYITELSYITEPTNPPTYDTGETIKVAATFSETITPDTNNLPAIPLKIGSNTRNATYASGSADKLEFHYTVVAADQDNNGITIEQNSMTGNVLKTGGTGVVADLDHIADNNNPDRRVNLVPTVTSVRITSSPEAPNWYTTGETIEFTVTFSIPITVTGDPTLRFEIGTGSTPNADRDATYIAADSTTKTMVFQYTVVDTDVDTDGIHIDRNTGTILLDANDSIQDGLRTTGKKDAVLTHGTVGGTDSHRVSPLARVVSVEVTSNPTAGTNSDTYSRLTDIEITVTFNNDITVDGNPEFQIHVGSNSGETNERRLAQYYPDLSAARTMVFQYQVAVTDMDNNGIRIGDEQETFQLGADYTIKDSADRDAALNHSALGTLSGHKVDGSLIPPPSIPSFPDVNPPDGADPITMTVAENSAAGTAVGRVRAVDLDGDFSTYSSGGADTTAFNEVFTLTSTHGVIRVKPRATVDYESRASYSITISVTDGEDASGNPETPATIDDTVAVTINVTDLEEDGVITLSRATPSVGTAITATLTDSDGGVTDRTWQWAKSDTETGSFTNISGATSDSYTPVTADIGKWLKVTASYTDRRGSGKSSDQTAANAADDTPHKVPAFATQTITLTVAENAPVGVTFATVSATDADGDRIYHTLPGTDSDHAAFGTAFHINQFSGAIGVKSPSSLDYETKASYSVTIQVTDREDALGAPETPITIDDTIAVTINVTNVDEASIFNFSARAPVTGTPFNAVLTDEDGGVTAVTWQWAKSPTHRGTFTNISGATGASYTPVDADLGTYLKVTAHFTDGHGPGKSYEGISDNPVIDSPHKVPQFGTETRVISVDENSPGGTLVKNIRISDPDGDELRYSLGGTDASDFNQVFHLGTRTAAIQVKLGGTPDYESKSSYSITVNVTDREDANGNAEVTATIDDSIDITININNLEEHGLITLSANTPMVGSEYRATLTDPDGGIAALNWQWAKGATKGGAFDNIAGAASSNYTPVDADENQYLKATASYDDGHGTGKSASRVSDRQASNSPFRSPTFAVDSITFNLAENTAGRVTVGNLVATDHDGDTVHYSLSGPDAAAFTSETSLSQPGASIILQVFTAVDYEAKQSYSLVLSVTDREDESGNQEADPTVDDTVQITVNVLNVEEPGRLALSPGALELGITATVSLTDPDGNLSGVSWQWSRSDSGSGPFSDITGETNPTYTPLAADNQKFLKVRVSYTDGQDSGKSAELITYVYDGQTIDEPTPVDFPMTRHTRGALRVGETSTGRLDSVDDNPNAPEHAARIPRGDMFKIEGLTAGNSYQVRAWFGASKEDSATAARGGAIGLQFSRSGIELASLSPHNDNLLDDGRASFVFPAFANDEYYVDVVAPAFRPPSWAFPAHIYFGPYMLEIYDLGVTQRPVCVGETCSLNEGYGIKASNICVNNRCYNDPRFPEFHDDSYANTESHEVSVGNNPVSKDFFRGALFGSLSSTPTAKFQLDRIGVFLHSMTAGSIPQAAVHTLTGLYPGDKLFDMEPLYNDDAHIDYFIAPQGAQALNRGITYAVIFTEGGGSNDSYKLYVTANITDDDDTHPKWYVENAGVTKDADAASPTWASMRLGDTSSGTQVLPQIRVYAGIAE